jgi:hypothetical protein
MQMTLFGEVFTPAEQEQHRIQYADALIEHEDEQIAGEYITQEGVCAVGVAFKYMLNCIATTVFENYFGIPMNKIVKLNESCVYEMDWDGHACETAIVNRTFPEIADFVKNWKVSDND